MSKVYEKGAMVPSEIVDFTEGHGVITFRKRVRVEYLDGWCDIHSLEPGERIIHVGRSTPFASIHFNEDIRIYQDDGSLLTKITCSPGTLIGIEDTGCAVAAAKFQDSPDPLLADIKATIERYKRKEEAPKPKSVLERLRDAWAALKGDGNA